MKKFKVFFACVIALVIAFSGCKKLEEDLPGPLNNNGNITPESPFQLKVMGLKYANGDTVYLQPDIAVLWYIDNPTAGSWYDWDFCGTTFNGATPDPINTNIAYTFTTTGPCTVTITEHPSMATITVTAYVTLYNPLLEPLILEGSSQNLDGTWRYNLAIRKDRVSVSTGMPFHVGEHTMWALNYGATTTPTDSLLHFNIDTYNQMFKFNGGLGTTWASVTPSYYQAPGAPVDNNFQVYFWEGTIQNSTYAPTIVSPGNIGDAAGPVRFSIDALNVTCYFQISNFVTGSHASPYFSYRFNSGAYTANLPLTWVNGNGWATATIPISSIPTGATISIVYGAAGGQANMTTSMFYVPSAAALQVQMGMITP